MSSTSKVLSPHEVALHNKDGDLWVIVDDVVFDLSTWQDEHPGGKKILIGVAGKDATKKYRKYHGDNVLRKYGEPLRVGILEPNVTASPPKKSFFSRFRSKS